MHTNTLSERYPRRWYSGTPRHDTVFLFHPDFLYIKYICHNDLIVSDCAATPSTGKHHEMYTASRIQNKTEANREKTKEIEQKTDWKFFLQVPDSSGKSSSASSLVPLQTLHLQQTMQGAASRRRGLATNRSKPKPAKMPMTWVLCQMTEALVCPNLFLHGPLS